MTPEISEFSFGYCFTVEAVSRFGVRQAPVFPTQNQEAVDGFDIRLNRPGGLRPVFFQYKRSDYLFRRNALNWANLGHSPYYRFSLMARRHSRQHEILLDLESRYPDVYYAAPRFHTYGELDRYYRSGSVYMNSFILKPSGIPPIVDDNAHSISFARTGATFIMNSKPIEGRNEHTFSWEGRSERRMKSEFQDVEGMADYLLEQFVAKKEKFDSEAIIRIRDMAPVPKLLYLAKVGLGLECLFQEW